MTDLDRLRFKYLEAVRLHLWYSESAHSFQQGKASKEWARKYRVTAHMYMEQYVTLLKKMVAAA